MPAMNTTVALTVSGYDYENYAKLSCHARTAPLGPTCVRACVRVVVVVVRRHHNRRRRSLHLSRSRPHHRRGSHDCCSHAV